MGDPKFPSKKYRTPKKPWDLKLLEHERGLRETYGLRNKREIRGIDTILRKKRSSAKHVLALPLEQRTVQERELLDSLVRVGIMRGKPSLNEVLSLTIEAFLERRLQTIVWRKNLATTVRQARQFITHGHIAVNGKKVSAPSYLVSKAEEATIAYHKSPMVLQSSQKAQKDQKQLAKDFAEMRGEPGGTETPLLDEASEVPVSPDAADAVREAETEEGK